MTIEAVRARDLAIAYQDWDEDASAKEVLGKDFNKNEPQILNEGIDLFFDLLSTLPISNNFKFQDEYVIDNSKTRKIKILENCRQVSLIKARTSNLDSKRADLKLTDDDGKETRVMVLSKENDWIVGVDEPVGRVFSKSGESNENKAQFTNLSQLDTLRLINRVAHEAIQKK